MIFISFFRKYNILEIHSSQSEKNYFFFWRFRCMWQIFFFFVDDWLINVLAAGTNVYLNEEMKSYFMIIRVHIEKCDICIYISRFMRVETVEKINQNFVSMNLIRWDKIKNVRPQSTDIIDSIWYVSDN